MAQLVKIEGDYSYWDDGSVRWAADNSLGKQKGALAKRHPLAAPSWGQAGAGLRKAKADGRKGQRVSTEVRRQASLDALAEALKLHPDSKTVQDGLRMLWAARVEQAGSPDARGAGVKAHEMIERVWSGPLPKDPTVVLAPVVQLSVEAVAYLEELRVRREANVVEATLVELPTESKPEG